MELRRLSPPEEEPLFEESLPCFGGGPMDTLLSHLGCAGCGKREARRRVALFVLTLWLPPFVLAGLASLLAAHPPVIGIFRDFSFHVRYLVAIPILLYSECAVQRAIGDTIPVLKRRGIIRDANVPALARTEARMRTLRDSFWSEGGLFALSIFMVSSGTFYDLPAHIASWKSEPSGLFALARGWNHLLGMPVYYFLGLRWLFKFALWTLFLFRVARLSPKLQGQHPDKRGGLAFLIARNLFFAFFVLALSSVISANIGAMVYFGGAELESFVPALASYVAVVELVFLVPLLVFTPSLVNARWEALIRYGNFGNRYARDFSRKWLRPGAAAGTALGSQDIQALNDLMGSYAHAEQMVPILASKRGLIGVTFFALAPFFPLLLLKLRWWDLLGLVVKSIR